MTKLYNKFIVEPSKLPSYAKEITSSSINRNDNGIFSDEVFYDKNSIGYIKIPPCPKYCAKFAFEDAGKELSNKLKQLLTYEAYLYEDSNKELKLATKAPKKNQKIWYGIEAAKKLYPDIKDWTNYWTTDFIIVPHPRFRPLIKQHGKDVLGEINSALINILDKLEIIKEYDFIKDYHIVKYYRKIYQFYMGFVTEIYRLFTNGSNCFIRKELKSNKFPGMIRATLINRCDLNEDEILIGDDFIKTLWPWLYEDCKGDMKQIQIALDAYNYLVILNRPPSISWGSLLALKPKIASVHDKNSKSLQVIGINPIITPALAGDFDGDNLLVFSLYSYEANKEAQLMLPSRNYYDFINGSIRNKLPLEVDFINKFS